MYFYVILRIFIELFINSNIEKHFCQQNHPTKSLKMSVKHDTGEIQRC